MGGRGESGVRQLSAEVEAAGCEAARTPCLPGAASRPRLVATARCKQRVGGKARRAAARCMLLRRFAVRHLHVSQRLLQQPVTKHTHVARDSSAPLRLHLHSPHAAPRHAPHHPASETPRRPIARRGGQPPACRRHPAEHCARWQTRGTTPKNIK